jgi:hypothetical protein
MTCAAPAMYVPLQLAMICTGCDCIAQLAPTCPACGSEEIFALSRWLDREPEPAVAGRGLSPVLPARIPSRPARRAN